METWYLEYAIRRDRPGLLGDVATLLGMLGVNIEAVRSLPGGGRAFLLRGHGPDLRLAGQALQGVADIQIVAVRPPLPADLVTLRHGQKLQPQLASGQDGGGVPFFSFVRSELGVLVDFMAQEIADGPRGGRASLVIGIRGQPKVGKTEAAIAACVSANRPWVMISGTIFRLVARSHLLDGEKGRDCVYLLDAAASLRAPGQDHKALVQALWRGSQTKLVEHPDLFVREGWAQWEDFDFLVELRRCPEEAIEPENISTSIRSFDVS